MTYKSQHLSVTINRPAAVVYEYVRNPENLPEWAEGFVEAVWQVNGQWVAESSMGTLGIRFEEENDFGVLDHVVTLPQGTEVLNPMRVFANGDGCEVLFTVFKSPDAADKEFVDDMSAVYSDLFRLKEIMEEQ